MQLLNVGCGKVFHSQWLNLDSVAQDPAVQEFDVRRGLPFSDASIAACYSSHMIEHLIPAEAKRFLDEVFRILLPGGIVRTVVPDLELLANNYLDTLSGIVQDANREDDYDWTVIQLLDQTVRRRSGGEMSRFFADQSRKNDRFVIDRAGPETESVLLQKAEGFRPSARSLAEKIRDRKPSWFIKEVRHRAAYFLVRAVAGKPAAEAFKEGVFRNSGEIHQWMYDRYSLGRLLKDAGFANPVVCAANYSQIPDFSSYELDVVNGRVRKPDSLFIEAVKPNAEGVKP